MTLLRCNNKIVYFAHIPKTGGSSVEFALRQAGATRALHFHKKLDYVKCNLQHMHAELFDTFVPPNFYDFGFCVVRHPIARLASEFRWRNQIGNVKRPFDDWVNHHLNAYKKDPYVLDNHIRPQLEFAGKKIIVFKFEEGISSVIEKLSVMTDLPLDSGTHRRKTPTGDPLKVTTKTLSRAISFYQEDFEKFHYDESDEISGLTVV